MTAYAQIKQLPVEVSETLIKLGFLKSTFLRNVAIYERYLEHRESGRSSTDAAVYTADEFGISDRYVFSIIRKFSETNEYER